MQQQVQQYILGWLAKQYNGPRRGNSEYISQPLYTIVNNKEIQVVFDAKVTPDSVAELSKTLRETVYNA